MTRLREAKKRQDEEVGRVQEFIDRFRYQATKAAQVQSRIKMLEKVERIEVPPERKRIHFKFPASAKSGRMVQELKAVRKAYGDKVVLYMFDLHIERGDRIALVGPNGAGKSTLMRMLSQSESPDGGTLTVGHQVIVEYFAQDEAVRLNPALTVYETLHAGSPNDMVPAIRNILGGFLFSGDDIHKKAAVLSGGERTRLAVARMLLRPSNTLLLDEPTNHLDLDSKDVLLEALEDYGGTLILVSHDRYFVEKLATKIIEIGHGGALVYPGTYTEFLWSKKARDEAASAPPSKPVEKKSDAKPTPGAVAAQKASGFGPRASGKTALASKAPEKAPAVTAQQDREERKRLEGERKKKQREQESLRKRIADIESRIASSEAEVKHLEAAMSEAGFYEDSARSKPVIDRHQALMWEVGDLMAQWEALQNHAAEQASEP
jgi:ATP-binding cassette subfamily F protein 3